MPDIASPTPPRADARRNIESIIQAAVVCLGQNPDATLGEIAHAAGVGKVTLYGHFPSREILIEAAIVRALEDGELALNAVNLGGPPFEVLRSLIETGWRLTAQAGTILEAAKNVLSPARIHELHARPEQRVNDLIRRGQAEDTFRTDLPADWLASMMHHVMKGAAADVSAGRLSQEDAGRFIAEVVVGAYSPRAS